MEDLNSILAELYDRFWDKIKAVRNEHKGLSGPLLMELDTEYGAQHKRLFVIGQQTQNWDEEDSVSKLQGNYKYFIAHGARGGPFWNESKRLMRELGLNFKCIAWNNLNRMDFNDKRPDSVELEEKMVDNFPLLREEIKICNPTHIVFFTGPDLDWLIKKTFPGVEFKKNTEYPEGVEALSLSDTPNAKCYRTRHPRDMYNRRRPYKEEVMNMLISDFKQ